MSRIPWKLLVLLALIPGCVSVRSATAPHTDLGRYRTWAWLESPTKTRAQLEFERSVAGELVRQRIERDLAAKGLHQTLGQPDFLVAYRTDVEERYEINEWAYPRLYWGAPGPTHVDAYNEGTLVVDFIDPPTGRVFWRGIAQAMIGRPARPNLDKLASAVDRMMTRYPAATVVAGAPRPAM